MAAEWGCFTGEECLSHILAVGRPKVLGPPKPAPEKDFLSHEQSWLETQAWLRVLSEAPLETGVSSD